MRYIYTRVTIIVLLSIFSCKIVICKSDWKVYWKSWEVDSIYYSTLNESYKVTEGYLFLDSPYDTALLRKAFFPITYRTNPLNNSKDFVWIKKFDPAINIDVKNTLYKIRSYGRNINFIEVFFHSLDHEKWFSNIYDLEYEGYQVPLLSKFSKLREVRRNSEISGLNLDRGFVSNINIDSVLIKVYPGDEGNFNIEDFALANFEIFKKKDIKVEVQHDFFDELLDLDSHFDHEYYDKMEDDPIIMNSHQGNFRRAVGSRFFFESNESVDSISENSLFVCFMQKCFEWYPFYKERNISKDSILLLFSSIREKTLNSEIISTAKQINKVVKSMNDGHFSINLPIEDKIGGSTDSEFRNLNVSPIRLIKINGRYLIAAVFDESLSSANILNKEVVSIDGININTLLDSLKTNYELAEPLALIEGLKRPSGGSLALKYKENAALKDCIIRYDKPFIIPNNFKPQNYKFEITQDSIAYLKLNNFSSDSFIRFANYIEEIQMCRGLVIDLRGNGGGNSYLAMRYFSTFIDRPTIFSHSINRDGLIESTLVKPNRNYHIDLPLVVLIDKGTACASESFVDALKMANRATIIGKSSTSGTFASVFEIKFPSGITVKINFLHDKQLVSSGEYIESHGLSPDIWVRISNVYDLFPYEDVVLKRALDFLKYYKNRKHFTEIAID